MGSDEPLPDRCGSKRRQTDGYCRRYPAVDDDGEVINGRCKLHGGTEGIGAPEGSANALQHGATASHETLKNHLDDEELAFIEDLADRYRRVAGYDVDDPRAERIEMVCLSIWQEWQARSESIVNDQQHTAVVGTNEEGQPVRNKQEHYLGPAASRLSREIRQNLKEMGLIGDDTETISTKSAAQIIAQAVESSPSEPPHPQDVDASEDEPIDPPTAAEASEDEGEEADPR
jgi:hypothetical protein